MTAGLYNYSLTKRLLDVMVASVILILTSPLMLVIAAINKLVSPGPVFFIQKRSGIKGKPFNILKFRTMVPNAEKIKSKYIKFNESDGPAFKISNDPRFTPFGKFLSKTGMDELPQFINVLKGDMSVVGPRPLPIVEASKLSKNDRLRNLVKPGITSSWVIGGSHKLKFKKWMMLDRDYIVNASFRRDIVIILKTGVLIAGYIVRTFRPLRNY